MTIEEKISFLKQVKILLLESNSWLEDTKEPIRESFDTAIKSLEAWEKVKEEIKALEMKDEYGDVRSDVIHTWEVLAIIDKHLSEVEK